METSKNINGVDFVFTADSDKNGFYGRWICRECGETHVSNHLDSTQKNALIAARVSASLHAKNCPSKATPSPMEELKKEIFGE